METVTLIRIITGALALVAIGFIIYRRSKKTVD
jgi:hypothetical protein